jgi:hypothetical protein
MWAAGATAHQVEVVRMAAEETAAVMVEAAGEAVRAAAVKAGAGTEVA